MPRRRATTVERSRGARKAQAASRKNGVHPAESWGEVDEEFIRKVSLPFKIIRSYCRVTFEGIGNVPGQGPAVIAANHTGWLGLDYANLAITIHDRIGRIPRGVVHPLWFSNAKVSDAARRLGLMPANKDLMAEMLKKDRLVIIFPEAEQGAFKPTVKSGQQYRLLEFKRGFVRVAMATGAPIVPVAIIGGEEANPVLKKLPLTDLVFRLPLPRPTNLIPRRVKWRVSCLPPIPMDHYSAKDAEDADLVHKITADIKRRVQKELKVQLKKRGNPYR